ncbi:pentapeptide repeat-containing protein [Leisingera sp. McT4-56]|uniref:pentapeptide repeat-containing protein n=1 Tax=Leisingera sp. McT4-56 TaxID=2881255 RepID=UPI001CF927A1|nr:pentapeptide repeat-containing protein [Leisingera sp. McT4-56]MCB4455345.1 pentapeptide repeat-containing protein [Leisingera sp. McT4-56]
MRDETEAPEAPATLQSKLKPANENPWYVLMTLYGDDHDRNRAIWNAWVWHGLSKEEKRKLVGDGVIVSVGLLDWENIQDEVISKFEAEFKRRNEPHCPVPDFPPPHHSIRLSRILVEDSLEFQRWVFPSGVNILHVCFKQDVDFEDALFLDGVSIRRTVFEGDVNFLGTSFFGRARFFANFGGDLSFSESRFNKPVNFHDSEFMGYVSFSRTTFFGRGEFC